MQQGYFFPKQTPAPAPVSEPGFITEGTVVEVLHQGDWMIGYIRAVGSTIALAKCKNGQVLPCRKIEVDVNWRRHPGWQGIIVSDYPWLKAR